MFDCFENFLYHFLINSTMLRPIEFEFSPFARAIYGYSSRWGFIEMDSNFSSFLSTNVFLYRNPSFHDEVYTKSSYDCWTG